MALKFVPSFAFLIKSFVRRIKRALEVGIKTVATLLTLIAFTVLATSL